MSKPAPLSRTKNVRGSPASAPTSIRAALALPGIFPGIAEQVLERDGQQPRIALGREPVGDDEFDLPLGLTRAQLRRRPSARCATDRPAALKFAARDLRQCQHVVDELRHLLRRFPHIGQILLAVVVELVGIVLEQRQAEAVDAAQRRAQIVRHRIAEGFQLLVLGLELGDQLGALLGHFAGGARLDRFDSARSSCSRMRRVSSSNCLRRICASTRARNRSKSLDLAM